MPKHCRTKPQILKRGSLCAKPPQAKAIDLMPEWHLVVPSTTLWNIEYRAPWNVRANLDCTTHGKFHQSEDPVSGVLLLRVLVYGASERTRNFHPQNLWVAQKTSLASSSSGSRRLGWLGENLQSLWQRVSLPREVLKDNVPGPRQYP